MSFQILAPEQSYPLKQIHALLTGWPRPQVPPEAVAIQSPNSSAYVLRLLALWSQQQLVLPLDPKIPSAEVQALLQREGFSSLETADTLATDRQAALKAASRTATLSTVAHPLPQQNWQSSPEHLMPFEQPASLIRTSGSSAYPKLAQHSWGNHVYSAQGSLQYLPLSSSDRWLLSLPLYHVGGLAIVVRCWLAGAALAIPDPQQSLAEALLYFAPTHLSLVPTQLLRLLDDPHTYRALQHCKAILLGGAPVSAELLRLAKLANLRIHTSYGATEMSSQITTTPPDYWRQTPLTPVVSGTLLPHRELRFCEGEVQVRGKTLFQGYREQQQLRLPLQEGWFATGDLGHWHHGQLLITGRKDYQFISGGENIQPEEVERYLLRFCEVQEAMVVPVTDHEFGARPVAILRLDSSIDAPLFFETLPKLLRLHLPKFKIPLAFYLWPESLQQRALKPRRKDFQAYVQALRNTE